MDERQDGWVSRFLSIVNLFDRGNGGCPPLPPLPKSRDGATGRSCSCSTRIDFLHGNCTIQSVLTSTTSLHPPWDLPISFRSIKKSGFIRRAMEARPRISNLPKKMIAMIIVTFFFFINFIKVKGFSRDFLIRRSIQRNLREPKILTFRRNSTRRDEIRKEKY